MRKTLTVLAATALATLFVASSAFEPAAAQRGHQNSGPSVGGGTTRAPSSGGVRSYSPGPSAGTHQFSRTYRTPSTRSSGVYAYRSHPRRHARHFRRGVIVGAPLAYGYYYSDSCYWLRRRALETGSSYWWNRYYDCLEGYDYY